MIAIAAPIIIEIPQELAGFIVLCFLLTLIGIYSFKTKGNGNEPTKRS
jgi:hypothetical protein